MVTDDTEGKSLSIDLYISNQGRLYAIVCLTAKVVNYHYFYHFGAGTVFNYL